MHLQKYGCPKCSKNKKLTTEEFIERSKKIHGDNRYDYSKVKYVNAHTKICIICNNHKHPFEFWQSADSHLKNNGCPKCNASKGEIKIENFLIKNKIKFEEQKQFNDCKYKQSLLFDFYLFQYNLCIEFDGQGHFQKINWSGKMTDEEIENNFKNYQLRDQIKNEYCKNNNINLLRIKYDENVEEKLTEYFQIHGIIK